MEADVTYYDVSGNMLSTDDSYIGTFQKGKKSVVTFSLPHDSNYNTIDYDKADIKIKADVDFFGTNISKVDDIKIESNKGSEGLMAKITNQSKEEVANIDVTALYYVNGEIIGYDEESVYSLSAGDDKTVEFSSPIDGNYNYIAYDDYEIIIDEAYSYK